MKPRWPLILMAILAVLMLLAGIAGFIYDNMKSLADDSTVYLDIQVVCESDGAGAASSIRDSMEFFEDGSVTLSGVQISCDPNGLCNRENLPATTSETDQ